MVEGIGKRLGLRRRPEIALLAVRFSPFVWFVVGRPRIYFPAELLQRLDAAAQEAVLTHELAHIRRKDHWVRLLELMVTTLFWWHPVVWWASRQLQELEEQCCDGLVLDTMPQGARAYATALVDMLDFISDRSLTVPVLATVAKSPVVLARRITMLNNHSPQAPLTITSVALLAALVAIPMAIAFAAQAPTLAQPSRSGDSRSIDHPALQRRAINRRLRDFPNKIDLSTPESALASWLWVASRTDDHQALLELNELAWENKSGPVDRAQFEHDWKVGPRASEAYKRALLDTEIVEVATYRGDYAFIICKPPLLAGGERNPFDLRHFGRINGVWWSLGGDALPSLEAARKEIDRNNKKNLCWESFVELRDRIKSGRPATVPKESKSWSAPIAPGEPLGISVEKADLMGRIEWLFMHGARDFTARKSIEWGEVEKDGKGNRSIRYKFTPPSGIVT